MSCGANSWNVLLIGRINESYRLRRCLERKAAPSGPSKVDAIE